MDHQHFFLPLERGTWISVRIEELIMIEAGTSYATLSTIHGNYLSLLPLGSIERKLGVYFCRTHRSFIVSIHHIQKILPDSLVLTGLREVPLTNSYRSLLFQRLLLLD